MNIILFRGRPGAGKTLLSSLLAQQLNLPVLRKDDIYDALAPLNPDHQLRNRATYRTLYTFLQSNRQANLAVILDFPFQSASDIGQIRQWCADNQVGLQSILVTCTDEQLWASRFNQRAENPAPNQLITDFEQLKKHYGDMQLQPEADELLIDTVNKQTNNILEIVKFISLQY